ncbi:hypothetical protein [Actinoplanes flavus]|uniref:Uncharacterized protein n=1 Tax=Actinoplanes flavus TaxID=2820290 RepID=A0ABS3UIE0_9ACTN|nr:hypothetical protein [Actinoplanes flavus]MBO3738548.1 hypothetical protein [Actinoplanes flavus]
MIVLRRTVLFADHAQFYLSDHAAADAAEDLGDWPEPWSGDAVDVHHIGLDTPHSLAVGTARSDHVAVVVRLAAGEPPLSADAVHIVETDLDVPTGTLSLHGCAEIPGPAHELPVAAGRYRARVSFVPTGAPPHANPVEPGRHFLHLIDLWPSGHPRPLGLPRPGPPGWTG